MSTIGKRVTLPLGAVCTDVGPATVNGEPDERVRLMADPAGATYWVLASVIAALPPTARREALPDRQARHPTRGL